VADPFEPVPRAKMFAILEETPGWGHDRDGVCGPDVPGSRRERDKVVAQRNPARREARADDRVAVEADHAADRLRPRPGGPAGPSGPVAPGSP
jgi:hypothetical protein